MEQILFYRPQNPYGSFANFSQHSVEYKGFKAKTSEHMFQAMKFYPAHPVIFHMILRKDTPREAALAGRDTTLPLRADWDYPIVSDPKGTCISLTKDLVMYEILKDKFTRYSELKELLLSTRGKFLVEDSPIDYYWGWGEDHSGKNMLGRILVLIRDIDFASIV